MIDVMVTSPVRANGITARAAATQLATATFEERNKANERRRAHADADHQRFVPFVIETYGAIGNEASRTIKAIADHAAEVLRISPLHARQQLRHLIATHTQLGNASAITVAINNAHKHVHYMRGGPPM